MKRSTIAFAALALHWGSAAAQKPFVVGDKPSCARCAVDLKPVVRLGSIDDPAGYGLTADFAVAGSPRRYYAASYTFPGQIFQYDGRGKFVKQIGKPGEGPGEFSEITMQLFTGRGDSIHAFQGNGRYHVIAPDGAIKRSTTMGARSRGFVVLSDGVVFAGAAKREGSQAFMLQTFKPNGEPLAAMDKVPEQADFRYVGLDAKQQRWSAVSNKFDITQWTADGLVAKRFVAQREWLANAPIPMGRRDLTREKPLGQVAGISFGGDGNLYLFCMVADKDWKPGPTDKPDFVKIWDTLVEVVNPNTGELVARTRFDRMILPIGNGLAYSMLEDKEGDLRPEIYSFGVKR